MDQKILQALQFLSIPDKAEFLPRFFKTGKGEYAEGDQFLGVVVPDSRKVAKAFYKEISMEELSEVLKSEYHEMRLVALLMVLTKFEKATSQKEKKTWVDFYLKHTHWINNWDLVDVSCYKILGRYCFENQKTDILYQLSKSDLMWEKRMAVVGSLYFIKKGIFDLTLDLVLENLHHPHDLIHKANGWMLREIGKKDESTLLNFLHQYYAQMPRTSLRYAIEKLDENTRQEFLKKSV